MREVFAVFFGGFMETEKEKRRKMEEKNIQEIQRLHIQIEDILKRSLIFFKQY